MDDDAPDPADALAIIAAQRARAEDTRPSSTRIFALWGVAWLVGYGALWLTARDDGSPTLLAVLVAIGLGVVALVLTIVHVLHRTRGISGAGARQGALYGWAWPIGFVAQSLIVGGLGRAGASDEVTGLAANAIAALVVGLLYLAGGLLWEDTPMYVIGGWMALVGAVAAVSGLPGSYLVMSLAGGGGMLALGLVSRLRSRA
ncbi:hypothetical protein [uncultured Cellulomonas sp.]|uniref:hypothetical protein n=1 Tax=uncultured Cellulomonas sp. TaxID=189682 RepID=UPI0028E5CA36|nr:hypothetical protein [uncultured Cellulomonas sp.]